MKLLTTLFLLIYTSSLFATKPRLKFDHNHKKWNQILKIYVNDSGVKSTFRYKELKKQEHKKLKSYLHDLSQVTLKEYNSWSKNEQKAFLINSYNSFTVELILRNYPVKSIIDIGTFGLAGISLKTSAFDKKFFRLLGEKRNLSWIEHKKLRPQFNDYRIHFAINCASISCPKLRNEAYTAKQLEVQLNQQEQLFLQDPSLNYIDDKNSQLYVSPIFKWFKEDFNGVKSYLLKKLNKGRKISEPLVEKNWKIKYTDYSWQLNE